MSKQVSADSADYEAMMSVKALGWKHCPFCGNFDGVCEDTAGDDCVYLKCTRCLATGPTGDNVKAAQKKWNKRYE